MCKPPKKFPDGSSPLRLQVDHYGIGKQKTTQDSLHRTTVSVGMRHLCCLNKKNVFFSHSTSLPPRAHASQATDHDNFGEFMLH